MTKERVVVFVRKIEDCNHLQSLIYHKTTLKATVFNSSLSEEAKAFKYAAWRRGRPVG